MPRSKLYFFGALLIATAAERGKERGGVLVELSAVLEEARRVASND